MMIQSCWGGNCDLRVGRLFERVNTSTPADVLRACRCSDLKTQNRQRQMSVPCSLEAAVKSPFTSDLRGLASVLWWSPLSSARGNTQWSGTPPLLLFLPFRACLHTKYPASGIALYYFSEFWSRTPEILLWLHWSQPDTLHLFVIFSGTTFIFHLYIISWERQALHNCLSFPSEMTLATWPPSSPLQIFFPQMKILTNSEICSCYIDGYRACACTQGGLLLLLLCIVFSPHDHLVGPSELAAILFLSLLQKEHRLSGMFHHFVTDFCKTSRMVWK